MNSKYALLLVCSLAACAPQKIREVHEIVYQVPYVYRQSVGAEWKNMLYFAENGGNCYDHAMAEIALLAKAGYKPEMLLGRTGAGEGHAIVKVCEKECWYTDNRFPEVLRQPRDFYR